MSKHLEGKVALVTGGAGGMGSQICKVFAEQGAQVVVCDIERDVEGRADGEVSQVEAVVADIRAAGGEAVGLAGDIADMDTAERAVQTALDTYGDLDILVCAHGILRERMIFNMSEENWDDLVRIHLKGCFAPTKFAAIHWRTNRDKGGRRIIYFTSSAGVTGIAGQPNYSAAHAGKIGLMLSNAEALERYGATSNCISPEASTRMTDRGTGLSMAGSDAALGTSSDPKNVTPIIVLLASDEGEAISGRVLGASGNKITIWDNPEWESTIFSTEPYWNIDELFEVMPATLVAQGVGPPPRVHP
ncbi:MAG: NAD(P)-dependent dehydrogenase, short-chain alcohol dehydrogenase family [Chloroflexi bacterium]|nr:MAG: NAD(P)-dependent dehydrogenase, short-chain alcohol dehydrogenase family [Chloroflexota bacterium]